MPLTKPSPPPYVFGGRPSFRRIAELGAGWIALRPAPELLSGPLQELRDIAGADVPVTVCQWGEQTAKAVVGYEDR